MQFTRIALPLMAAIGLLAATATVCAEDKLPPPAEAPVMGERCRQNPEKCKEIKERMQARCKENPQHCEEMKQKRQQMREECRKDPQACKQKRAERREKMRQRGEEMCKQNPVKCEEWKKRHGRGDGPVVAPPNP